MLKVFVIGLGRWHRSGMFIKMGILATFLCTPLWMKFLNPPKPFTTHYVMGFVIVLPLMWSIGWWWILGLPGFKALLQDKLRSFWVFSLLLMALWVFASQHWAFVGQSSPEAATAVALQFCLVAMFVVCVTCTALPARWMTTVLVGSLVVHSIIGDLQVITQSSVGLHAFGELELNPQQSGISVIQSGVLRWLRPYGLLPHPNIFAGFMVMGLLATSPWILAQRSATRWTGTGIFLFGLWTFLLTFSRGAWLGFLVGTIILGVLLIRYDAIRGSVSRHIKITLILALMATLCFGFIYRALLIPRLGMSEEHTEIRSVNERIILIEIANVAIRKYPIYGVGAGNFPWFASDYIFYQTDLDMRGKDAHVVLLLIQAEYGIIGLGLTLVAFTVGLRIALRKNSDETDAIHRYALVSGVVAFAVIGLFDHYPWTILHTQILWWGALAVAGIASIGEVSAQPD